MQEQDVNIVKRATNGILSNFDYKKKELNQSWLKDLKLVVRKNQSIIPDFIEKLFDEFHKGNSDRRLGAMLISDYFFQRSHNFRSEIVEHIQDLLLFTIETDPLHYPLPEPLQSAVELKKESLKIIKSWIDKFEAGYSKLNTASQYLTQCKHFDFAQANEQLLVERQRAEEERIRKSEIAKKISEKTKNLFEESKLDIERTLIECRTSINLIYPDLFKEDVEFNDIPSTSSSIAERKKLHGYKANQNLSILINSDKIDIEETSNNEALIGSMKDSKILLNKYLKSIKNWLKDIVQADPQENSSFIKTLLDYRAKIVRELERCQQLRIKKVKHGDESSDENESDFEDVIDDEFNFLAPDLFGSDKSDNSFQQIEEPIAGPSGLNKSEKEDEDLIAGPSKLIEKKKPQIPTVEFGLDLKYWGQDIEPAMIPRNEFDGHPFWRAADPCDTFSTEVEDVYRSRQMTFVGERKVIKHCCRAPLPSGKLCPRMDFDICPLHGPKVPRDEQGFPIDELGKGTIEHMKIAEERLRKQREKDEEEYLNDIEAATGISMAMPKKGSRKSGLNKNRAYGTARKREKTQTAASRERLEKKLFNKSTMKRVAETLGTIQQQRASKNFSSQFNYALTRK